jgi:hypothetical protein
MVSIRAPDAERRSQRRCKPPPVRRPHRRCRLQHQKPRTLQAGTPPGLAAAALHDRQQRAQSSTLRQSGPTVSKLSASGTTPSSDSRPWVVLSPTRSFHADGPAPTRRCPTRCRPPPNRRRPTPQRPRTTPRHPGRHARSVASPPRAYRDRPGSGPTRKRPAPTCASCRGIRDPPASPAPAPPHRHAGTRPSSSLDPASVTVPALSNRSFQLIGTPSSRPRRTPLRARSRAASASPCARSGVRTSVDTVAVLVIRLASRYASVRATGSICPRRFHAPGHTQLCQSQLSISAPHRPVTLSRSDASDPRVPWTIPGSGP